MFVELFLLVLLLLFLLKFGFKSRAQTLYSKFPGPKPYPFVGNIFEFDYPKVEITETFKKLSFQHGPVFLMRLGNEHFVCLRDPHDIESVFSTTKTIDKAPMYDVLHPWINQGLFTSAGDSWMKQRKILTPAFHFKIIETFIPVFEKNASILGDKFQSMVGKDFDVMPLVGPCSLDIICETVMGLQVNAQQGNSPYLEAVDELTEIIAHRSFNILQRSFLFPLLPSGRRHNKLISYLHGITEDIIKERKLQISADNEESTINTTDLDIGIKKKRPFLDLLLDYNYQGAGMTDSDIRMQVDTFMVAGYDTVQSTTSFALHCLSQNPLIQERAYQEITEILGGSERDATYQDLLEMKYLEKVIKETLRRFPAAQFMARKASDDLELKSGYTVPKNSSVLILIEAMNHDPNQYPDPLLFNPDRFDNKNSHPYSFLPFGAGLRNCIGQKFAMLETKSIVSRVLRRFRLLPSDIPLVLRYDLVLRSSSGVQLKLEPRTSQ